MKQILSFGAGVQSTALLLMSCKGLLPKLDAAVFADVGNEPATVYNHLDWCIEYAKKFGIPVHIAKGTEDGMYKDVMNNVTRVDGGHAPILPYYTATVEGKREGISMRHCTTDYKIKPIIRCVKREVLKFKPHARLPKEPVCFQWIGISQDEISRAKPSREPWSTSVFPFLSWGIDSPDGKVWRRYQIINWLEENYPEIKVPRSACIVCPFHSNKEWRKIKENPEEWAEAVEFDKAVRVDKRKRVRKDGVPYPDMRQKKYLHPSCKPLDEVDLRSDEEKGQGNLWDNECEGMCGM
tara:strand:- start:24 stop:908 length:885 start_codon:yes stop_codon:yes gene_type:complete